MEVRIVRASIILLFSTLIVFVASPVAVVSFPDELHRAFPIVEPDPGHTKLRLAKEGLEAIERITTPIAAVAVIGPYRSGKSFLLNQLLSLSCYEGFGVGHMRDTKTKGIWVWGTPLEMVIDGNKISVLYLDTEGFESIGKSNVYDDRVKGQDVAFEPAKLLWLIQRDFLQGKSVQEMVNEALQQVPNSNGDQNIEQPHLQRTMLCDLKDSDLEPLYVEKREQLKKLVASIVHPKVVQGRPLNGKEFVSFLKQIVEALNKGEIPSTGSLVEVFNKAILERCLKLYSKAISNIQLPLPQDILQHAHEQAKTDALKAFEQQHFGQRHAKQSVMQLENEINKAFKNTVLANEYQSSKLCEALYIRCEDKMDQLQVLRLPSMAKFNAGFLQCNRSFQDECVGPSKANYEQRMARMLTKSKSLFIKEYNHRLFNWLVAFSLVMVVVGRFVIKFILVEIAAWIMFIFLETYTRMFWSSESLYYNPAWHLIVATWEAIVYSPFLDLDRWSIPVGAMLLLLLLYWKCYGRRKHGGRSLLPLYDSHRGGANHPRTD